MSASGLHRRQLLVGTASGVVASLAPGVLGSAVAQTPSQQIEALEARAARAGVPPPSADSTRALKSPATSADSYRALWPRLVELIDRTDTSRSARDVSEDAAELLGTLHRAQRSLAPDEEVERAARPAPTFEGLRAEYRKLFDTCTIRDQFRRDVENNIAGLRRFRARHEAVASALGTPWYFVGIIHSLECAFNFRTHLHNGDPLARKTVQVPSGRPDPWNPPNDWESSALDALRFKRFDQLTDWSLERVLYRWESYNGWGYRGKKTADGEQVNSPYLWSFSNQYRQGKYVQDHVWDPSKVSEQCGAVTMLRALVEAGEVTSL